jgi:hypothetical protein
LFSDAGRGIFLRHFSSAFFLARCAGSSPSVADTFVPGGTQFFPQASDGLPPFIDFLIFLASYSAMDNKRTFPRHRVLKGGTIEFNGGAIDCTVRNRSNAGAALDVTSPIGIPAQFVLVADGSQLPCHVVWRKENRIGVAFD